MRTVRSSSPQTRWVPGDAASLDVEVRRVPGTFDFLTANLPFGEGATFVRALVINRVDLATEVYEGEAFALHLHKDRAGFGNLRLPRDFNEPGHLLVPGKEWYLLVRCKPNSTTVIYLVKSGTPRGAPSGDDF